jgi:hypothetical protein
MDTSSSLPTAGMLPSERYLLSPGRLSVGIVERPADVPQGQDQTHGVWLMQHPDQPPDFVLYYLHGMSG